MPYRTTEEGCNQLVVKEKSASLTDMNSKIDDIRSDEVQEILARIPSWTVRWGITLIFGLIVMLLLFSWFVKYPDIIAAPMVLSTENPPVRLISKVSGRIVSLEGANGDVVTRGEKLGLVESPISLEEVNYLKNYIQEVNALLLDSSHILPQTRSKYAFGELQLVFNQLSKSCFEYKKMQLDSYVREKMVSLEDKINQYERVRMITKRQLGIAKLELKNVKYVLDENTILYKNGTISKMELFAEESKYHQKQMEVENLNKSIAEMDINLSNLGQELNDLRYSYSNGVSVLKNDIRLYINSIQSGLENWKLNYEITAPIDGRLVYLSNWKKNQHISSATPIFAVIPENEDFVANLKIASNGYGKIKVGQKVRISLNGFPSNEFGYLEGEVFHLNEMSHKGEYLVEVKLLNGMKSSYNINLEFTPEMEGMADVITDDLRVLERLFIQFNKLTKR